MSTQESLHPRNPAGAPDGGQFATKPGGTEADGALVDAATDRLAQFQIRTRAGDIRIYYADDLEHAREQHEPMMADDQDETIHAVFQHDGYEADPHQPRITMDVSCQDWDGDQAVLCEVRHIDITGQVMAMSPMERVNLLSSSAEESDDLIEVARADGRFDWDGPYEGHAAASLSEYVADERGRYWLAGWDKSGAMVRDAESFTSQRLMGLAASASVMSADARRTMGNAYRAADVAKIVEAEDAAYAVLTAQGVDMRDVAHLWSDAELHVGGNAHEGRTPNGRIFPDEHAGMAIANAALATYTRQFMRDNRFHGTDARGSTVGAYNAATSTKFTLAHYDALVGPAREVFFSVTDLDNSMRARETILSNEKNGN